MAVMRGGLYSWLNAAFMWGLLPNSSVGKVEIAGAARVYTKELVLLCRYHDVLLNLQLALS